MNYWSDKKVNSPLLKNSADKFAEFLFLLNISEYYNFFHQNL